MPSSFAIADFLAKVILCILPRRISNRIHENSSTITVYVLATQSFKTKPQMTKFEGVFATLLFDLALFGTNNFFIKFLIKTFTNIQNGWDSPFANQQQAISEIDEFCERLSIQSTPWIWEKPKEEYTSLNDFFSRTYQPATFPSLGELDVVSPACCTIKRYDSNDELTQILIKGCNYTLENIGLRPSSALEKYRKNPVLVGYLSPTDYHRVHAPIAGKCVHCQLENADSKSASVKFFGGQFNLLNENKRLVVVIEGRLSKDNTPYYVALVVVGGIGVDTIVFDPSITGSIVKKGQEISTFRAGGSAIAMFSSKPLQWNPVYEEASKDQKPVEVLVGASLAN